MSKRLFISLVALMSLSLMGIIFVQGYWIKTTVDNKEEQFSMNVNQVLKSVSEKIRKNEIRDYYATLDKMVDSLKIPKDSVYTQVFQFISRDDQNNKTYVYSHGVLEEDYNITASFFDSSIEDTATVKDYSSVETTTIITESFDEEMGNMSIAEKNRRVENLSALDEVKFEASLERVAKQKPIHKRLDKTKLELMLESELLDRGIDTHYEYGVYSNGLATKVKTTNYTPQKESVPYVIPLFVDSRGNSDFDLVVFFPKKKKFLISQIIWMALLSIIFTLIIVIAYSSALYQLIKQKQISEIKTDFINNMTHEFKTPIATINLALDAIKNPKVIDDKDKVKRYLGMIRDENKRMHAQVENVLRISKLEKNQLDIGKDRVLMHDLVKEAIAHVSLIVQDRKGYVNMHLEAERAEVLGNDMHLTNVLVNILDNAIKYSPNAPKIDVFTENVKNHIVIKVQDQGSGMSKAALKRVFEKFYREHTGNIHNVKGHGLGLAYVKRIIEDHQGEVYADSEKDKGSTFYIKLPLI
ncbi:sensor histidine kinase [Sungkyunkwania multivorans]|uniref:histidine kinase n=1 Tax=Sungkyunkwania multivorans TaxID=1173618 RepID=A0ABW3CVW8_9FLAO